MTTTSLLLLLLVVVLTLIDSTTCFSAATTTTKQQHKATAIIFPGFGNAMVDYVSPLGAPETTGFKSVLERRGIRVKIVPVERYDWIRVALGLFDWDFWFNRQRATGKAYGWYLQRAQQVLTEEEEQNNSEQQQPPILLIGHSAGGWLARATLGDGTGLVNNSNVRALVTLGAPHAPPPPGINCATRGALGTTNEDYPGSFLNNLCYVTVAGDAVTGTAKEPTEQEKRPVDDVYQTRGERSAQNVARINYQALLGKVEGVRGDGVIPVDIAHLDGAEQITLDGVLHSINEAGTIMPTDRWYGSENIVDRWLTKTLDLIQE